MRVVRIVFAGIAAMSVGAGLFAQESVPRLQDLIEVKGRDAEYQMDERGYTWVRTDKSGGDAYSYWREDQSGRCVSVRTSDGRYASIVYTPDFDCQGDGQADSGEASERKDEFATVCGVVVNREPHRYRCKAVDFYQGSQKTRTALHFPDQIMRLRWHDGQKVSVHVESMETRQTRVSVSEGETNFILDGKTYFYISNKDAARREVENFGN